MIWFIFTILVAVTSVSSDFGRDLTITDSSQKVTLRTIDNLESNNEKMKCSWLISAPSNVVKWKVLCGVPTTNLVKCALGLFYFKYIDLNITMCVGESISEIIKGSTPTSSFAVRRSISVNSAYKGVTFMVSYNPKDTSTSVKPSCKCGKKEVQRIIGGKETTPNEYPWMALLMYKSNRQQFCGGSLIANQWVLSAAHCVKKIIPSSILVVLGEHDYGSLDSFRQESNVADKFIHEDFNQNVNCNNDFVLLKLMTVVTFNEFISPVCLPLSYKDYDFTNKAGITTGWGRTSFGVAHSNSKVLKQIDQRVIMPDPCISWYDKSGYLNLINKNMICAIAHTHGSNNGDSGGPLVWRSDYSNLYFQLGVFSCYWHMAGEKYPNIYARVSQFVDWIMAITGFGDELCNKL